VINWADQLELRARRLGNSAQSLACRIRDQMDMELNQLAVLAVIHLPLVLSRPVNPVKTNE
jgi:hypothetical protein